MNQIKIFAAYEGENVDFLFIIT